MLSILQGWSEEGAHLQSGKKHVLLAITNFNIYDKVIEQSTSKSLQTAALSFKIHSSLTSIIAISLRSITLGRSPCEMNAQY